MAGAEGPHLAALDILVEHAAQRLASPVDGGDLRPEARALDAAYQELAATAAPLWRVLFGPGRYRLNTTLAVAGAVRYPRTRT